MDVAVRPAGTTLRREFYSCREVMKVLGTCHTTVYEAVKRGEIPSVRIGGCIRIPRSWLEKALGVEMPD